LKREKAMSQSIEIPDHLAASLAHEAKKLGISVNDLAIRVLESECHPVPERKTGTQVADLWRAAGVIGSRSDIEDAQIEARSLRRQSENRGRG